MGNVTIRYSAYDFLFGFSGYVSIFYRFYHTMLNMRGASHEPVFVRLSVSVTSRCSTNTA